jgi:hypothetical protein
MRGLLLGCVDGWWVLVMGRTAVGLVGCVDGCYRVYYTCECENCCWVGGLLQASRASSPTDGLLGLCCCFRWMLGCCFECVFATVDSALHEDLLL